MYSRATSKLRPKRLKTKLDSSTGKTLQYDMVGMAECIVIPSIVIYSAVRESYPKIATHGPKSHPSITISL